ncbi:MAG: hypothetical protein R2939_06055 [Kofleriaceae bacterium]
MSAHELRREVVLACAPARAFALFTEHAGAWWPPERRHTSDPTSVIQLREDGRFFERAGDGTEVELGRVRVWSPPDRLVFDFYPGTDRAHPTEVEVRFAAVPGAADRTAVTLVHRATPASEALFGARAPRYLASWDLVLPAFVRAAELDRR